MCFPIQEQKYLFPFRFSFDSSVEYLSCVSFSPHPKIFHIALACEWIYQLLHVHKNVFLDIPKRSLIIPLGPSSSLGMLLSHGPFLSSGCRGLLLCCWARDSPHSLLSNLRNAVWLRNSPAWIPPLTSHHLKDYVRNVCKAYTQNLPHSGCCSISVFFSNHVLCQASRSPASFLQSLMAPFYDFFFNLSTQCSCSLNCCCLGHLPYSCLFGTFSSEKLPPAISETSPTSPHPSCPTIPLVQCCLTTSNIYSHIPSILDYTSMSSVMPEKYRKAYYQNNVMSLPFLQYFIVYKMPLY